MRYNKKMPEESTKEKIIKIVHGCFPDYDNLNEEVSFVGDLGVDSLDLIDLIMEVEDEFKISFPDEEAENIQTVGELIRAIQLKLE